MCVEVALVRILSSSLGFHDHVDPERFDEPVVRERAARCVSSPDRVLIVAVATGLVVGQWVAVVRRPPDMATELYVDDLAVAPAFRMR